MKSILNSVKKTVGIHEDYDAFDVDLIMAINSAFFNLMQLGVGPPNGFTITDGSKQWSEFLDDRNDLEAAKSYVFVSVRLLFDRPETSYGIQALERMRDEWAWRLEIQRREEAI